MPGRQTRSVECSLEAETTTYQKGHVVGRPFFQDVVFLGYETSVTVDVIKRQVGAEVKMARRDERAVVEKFWVPNGGERRAA
jgi:hypothetical protein